MVMLSVYVQKARSAGQAISVHSKGGLKRLQKDWMCRLFLFILTGCGGVSSVSGGGGFFINCRRDCFVQSPCLLASLFLQMPLYRKYVRRSWSLDAMQSDIAGTGRICCTGDL